MNKTNELPLWDKDLDFQHEYGERTLAGINVCRYLAENVKNKDFLIIGYDTK